MLKQLTVYDSFTFNNTIDKIRNTIGRKAPPLSLTFFYILYREANPGCHPKIIRIYRSFKEYKILHSDGKWGVLLNVF